MVRSAISRPCACQMNVAIAFDSDKAVLTQPLQRKRDCRPGDRKPMGESCGDDRFSLSFRFRNRLEVIFF